MLLATLSLPGCDDDKSSGADGGDVAFINLRAEDVSGTRAVIRFGTSRPTTCETEFGQDAAALDRSATDPTMGPELYALDHQVPLEDLLPATRYYYRARATDEQGVVFRSAIQQFVTEDAPVAPLLTNFASLDQGSAIVAVSSNFGGAVNGATWGANSAIDGLMSTEWATNGDGDNAWLDIDLGQVRQITRIEFRSRVMPDSTSIVRSIQLRFDESSVLAPYSTPDPDVLYGFDLETAISARRVFVEAVTTTGGNTGAREIRLLGPIPQVPSPSARSL
ncbi:MAG: discoidin domain-containing protein [bacterium]|nr:discoidin domain-containing protein [bacterium]